MTSSTSAAAAERKITLTTKLDPAENPFEVILYPDGAMAFATNHSESFVYLYRDQKQALKKILRIPEAQQTDTLSELRTVTMANQYKGKELWEVQIGGETAYYVGTLEEVIEKAKTHENYLHDEPRRGKPKPDQWNAGYPIGKIEKVGTLAG